MAAASNLTLLMKVFEQEKELFWRDNASLDEEELQRRWSLETGNLRSLLGAPQIDLTTANGTILQPPVPTSSATSMKREQSVGLAPFLPLALSSLGTGIRSSPGPRANEISIE